jgi:hypothetical protein
MVVRGVTVDGLVKRVKNHGDRPFTTTLDVFARHDWRDQVGSIKTVDTTVNVLDVVVENVRRVFERFPDRFDVPFLAVPLDRFEGAAAVPFAVSTWDCLSSADVDSDLDVMVSMTGTFRELVDRLGDMRAALDFAVTGHAWIVPNSHGSYGFLVPRGPATLEEAGAMARMRVFRARGLAPNASMYTPKSADVLGRRWAVGTDKAWTLDRCGELLGLTRERVRQIDHLPMWGACSRAWGRTTVLESVFDQLYDSTAESAVVESTGEEITRGDAVSLLVAFGYDEDDLQGPLTVADELELLGVRFDDVCRVAFKGSERLGFISETELRYHIAEAFPEIVGEFFEDVIKSVTIMSGLPHEYVYVAWRGSSYFRSWVISLVSVLGPQSIDDLYKASVRMSKWRIPRLAFPPRAVVQEFLERSDEFWIVDGIVGLSGTHDEKGLTGVEKWVLDTINGSTGQVIHSVELWAKGREAGIKNGTLRVYRSYSLYFKPLPGGLITITGAQPADVMIDLARRRASAIRIPTDRRSVSIIKGDVVVEIQVGNDVLDSGVLSSTSEMRKMLAGQRFKAVAMEEQFGNIGWSDKQMIGFVGVFQRLGVMPGDIVVLRFSVSTSTMVAEIIDE